MTATRSRPTDEGALTKEPAVSPSELAYTDSHGVERSAREYLERDGGDAPGSRYGTRPSRCVPVILALARIYADQSGELTADMLDGAASLVVNDHEDVALILADYGTPAECESLDADVLRDAK